MGVGFVTGMMIEQEREEIENGEDDFGICQQDVKAVE